ncbi:MAG: RNA polymerase sigma factor [Candidatus Dormibacteria bacterium]
MDETEPVRQAEAELIGRAIRGDADAYGRLVAIHQEVAFRAAWHVLGDATEAEDVAQDAFVKAYLALARFRPGAPFRPWLLRIVGNEARNRRRAGGRRQALAEAQARANPGDTAPSPADLAIASIEREGLLREVARLSSDDRQVIRCRYFLELSEEETAAVMDCRRGTVKSRLSRALRRLRSAMDGGADTEMMHG